MHARSFFGTNMSSSGFSLGAVSLLVVISSWVPWVRLFENPKVEVVPAPSPPFPGSAVVEHKVSCACDCGERLTFRVAIGLGFLVIVITTLLNIAAHCCSRSPRATTSYGKGKKGQVLSIANGA
jgi:hypothetical protein